MTTENPFFEINKLCVSFKTEGKTPIPVLHDVSFELKKGEILGIVGESGSGKSVTSLTILGLLPANKALVSGTINYQGKNLLEMPVEALNTIRGKEISMIFQEPMSSLNPSMTCGRQVAEVLQIHKICRKEDLKANVLRLFEDVKLPQPERVFNAYPHEISGGQKQRVMIAMAIACNPAILIADEPTTALDVTVQRDIITLLKEIQTAYGMSILFISHDLSLVSEIADSLVVMYKGKLVEKGKTKPVFTSPKHPYTEALLKSKPPLDIKYKRLPTIQDVINGTHNATTFSEAERKQQLDKLYLKPPLLEVQNLEKTYFSKTGLFSKKAGFKAVDNVSFKLYEGETLGLVGESGCGKSTLGNAITLLEKPTAGVIYYKGKTITKLRPKEERQLRKEIQIIFQDPYSSLNPRITIGQAIMEPMVVSKLYESVALCKQKTIELLEKVGLEEAHFTRYPHEFSGGQRQRIGIARAIALQPKIIICDESVSALDISVQAQVLNLLNDLKEDFGFSYIFISHDLAVVKYMSDSLLVMNQGKIEESGNADAIYLHPEKEYTKKLINAIPKGL